MLIHFAQPPSHPNLILDHFFYSWVTYNFNFCPYQTSEEIIITCFDRPLSLEMKKWINSHGPKQIIGDQNFFYNEIDRHLSEMGRNWSYKCHHSLFRSFEMLIKFRFFKKATQFETIQGNNLPLHRGTFCQFPFRWIYYCHSSKSTETQN